MKTLTKIYQWIIGPPDCKHFRLSDEEEKRIDRKVTEFMKYILMTAVGYVGTVLIYFIFSDVMGVSASLIAIILVPITTILGFFISKRWIFKQ